MEAFYEETLTGVAEQLGFLKAQIKGEGDKESQRALDDRSECFCEMAE